jgi:hypothetical protein
MRINRFIVGVIALALVAVTLAVALQNSGGSGDVGTATESATLAADNPGKPSMAPPILRAASAPELQNIDAWGATAFHTVPSARGPYSSAEMNAYGSR